MIDTKMLKPGDEVAVWYLNRNVFDGYQIKVVKSVCDDGLVELMDGNQYRREDEEDYLIPCLDNKSLLDEVSDEIRKKVDDVPYMRTILGFTRWYDSSKWAALPTEALRQIADIITANKPTQENTP